MKTQNILFDTAKWNFWNPVRHSLKTKKFPLKKYAIKIIFFQYLNKVLTEVRQKAQYEHGTGEPVHLAGTAHLI